MGANGRRRICIFNCLLCCDEFRGEIGRISDEESLLLMDSAWILFFFLIRSTRILLIWALSSFTLINRVLFWLIPLPCACLDEVEFGSTQSDPVFANKERIVFYSRQFILPSISLRAVLFRLSRVWWGFKVDLIFPDSALPLKSSSAHIVLRIS